MTRTHLPLLLILAASAALDACASGGRGDQALTPTEQYPLAAEATPERISLAPHAEGLSDAQRAAVADLAARYLKSGAGRVLIEMPATGGAPRAIEETGLQARDLLASEGVPEEVIERAAYDPAGKPALVRITFKSFTANRPTCGLEWEGLGGNVANTPMKNLGCAVSANMAAQISNPADISQPRHADPTDAGRRTTLIDAYRKGAADSSNSGSGSSGSSASGSSGSSGSGMTGASGASSGTP